jgi:hypothetical protein
MQRSSRERVRRRKFAIPGGTVRKAENRCQRENQFFAMEAELSGPGAGHHHEAIAVFLRANPQYGTIFLTKAVCDFRNAAISPADDSVAADRLRRLPERA